MKSKLGLILTLITLAAIAGVVMVVYNLTNSSKTNKGNGAISLEAPLFTSVAEASTGGAADAFPADEAGISAYVKVDGTIDIEKIKTIFTEVEEVGDNYVIGITTISDYIVALRLEDIDVHLYADIDGWLVAYLRKDKFVAEVMRWEEYLKAGGVIKSTALEDALYKAADAAGVAILTEIKYYDFKFPDANSMTIFTNDDGEMQVEIPANYTLYEASYNHMSAMDGFAVLKVDGTEINRRTYKGKSFGSYRGAITVGNLHTIEVVSTVATVLIYKAE